MADKSINELTEASELYDTGLTVVYQNNTTQSISGLALKTYAQNAVVNYAQTAAAIAIQDATDAATTATNAKNDAVDAKNDAVSAKNSAQAAQAAIEDMTVSSSTLSPGADATVTKTSSGGIVNLAFGLPSGATGVITSISRTSGTGAPGTTDTYTIYTNYGGTYTFQVYNGEDGTGTGDMKKADYDPNNTVYGDGGIVGYVTGYVSGALATYATLSDLADYVPTSSLGAVSGVATLDSNGKITASQASARIVAVSSNTTLSSSHYNCLLRATGTITITIPAGLDEGSEIEIMNYGTGTITVQGAAGTGGAADVILNGVTSGSKQITERYTSAVLKCVATNTWVIQGAIT